MNEETKRVKERIHRIKNSYIPMGPDGKDITILIEFTEKALRLEESGLEKAVEGRLALGHGATSCTIELQRELELPTVTCTCGQSQLEIALKKYQGARE